MKTRIRRLYDIANILQSLQLIQKVQITESNGIKKPAFQYIGPEVGSDDLSKDAMASLPSTRQRNSLLAVGKNLLNIPDEEEPSDLMTASSPPASIISSPTMTMMRSPKIIRSTSSSDLVKPLKKRFFHFDNNQPMENSLKRPLPTSLIDLSNACEAERQKIRRQGILTSPRSAHNGNLIRISPQANIRRSHIISPLSSHHSSAVTTLLRKPLFPLTSLIRKPVVNHGQKTVIAVMPPMDLSKRSKYY